MRQPLIESLESRTLLSFPDVPPDVPDDNGTTIDYVGEPRHVQLARQLVAEVAPPDNGYGTPTHITWRGIDGATVSTNFSVCSTFITKLLKQAYNYTNTDFIDWTGESSPEAEDYYNAAADNRGFTRLMNIADVQVGDVFIAKYLQQTTDATGHIAMIAATPRLVSSTSTERRYHVSVIDSSSSYHGTGDTRYRIDPTTGDYDEGVGQGTMRMITDTHGMLIKYSWSTLSNSVIYDATERPSLLAEIPPHDGGVVNSAPPPQQQQPPQNPFHDGLQPDNSDRVIEVVDQV